MILGANIDFHAYVYEVDTTGAGPRIVFHEINIAIPLVIAIAMMASDISVILNSLSIMRKL